MSNIITHNKHSKQVKGEKILPYPKTKKDQEVLVMEGRLMPDVIDKMTIAHNTSPRKIPMKNSPWTQGLVPKYVRTVLALSLLMSSSVLAFPEAVEPTFNSTTTANPGKPALRSLSKLFDSKRANSTTLINEQMSADLAMLLEWVCRFIRAVAFCVHFL